MTLDTMVDILCFGRASGSRARPAPVRSSWRAADISQNSKVGWVSEITSDNSLILAGTLRAEKRGGALICSASFSPRATNTLCSQLLGVFFLKNAILRGSIGERDGFSFCLQRRQNRASCVNLLYVACQARRLATCKFPVVKPRLFRRS